MMKRIILCAILILSASWQIDAQMTPTTINYSGPISTHLTHWSLAIKAGGNYMRTSPDDAAPEDMYHFAFGGSVEYSLNPLIGIGFDFTHNPYSRPSSQGDLQGTTIDGVIYSSINLSNFLDPYRTGFLKKMNFFSTIGAGMNDYRFRLNYAPEESHTSFLAVFSLAPEYNLNKSIALLLEGQYRFYDRGNMGGPMSRKTFSDALSLKLGIRFKLGAHKEGRMHACNISMSEWIPKSNPIRVEIPKIKDWSSEMDETNKRLQALEKGAFAQKSVNEKQNIVVKQVVPKVDVRFAFGSSKLSASSIESLLLLVKALKDQDWSVMNIIGNTDLMGSENFNMKLSFARAIAVKDYLITQGIDAARIAIMGNGEYSPMASNDTLDGRSKNRRVEVYVFR